jgi:two-component system sensor histidine kinase UhpB
MAKDRMLETAWFAQLMQHVTDEIYVIDAETLRLLYANDAACRRIDCAASDIAALRLENVFPGVSEQRVRHVLAGLDDDDVTEISLATPSVSKDGATHPARLQLLRVPGQTHPVLVAIGAPSHAAFDTKPSDSPLDAAVSGMPVLFFRLMLNVDGSYGFPYLSTGCESLLGISPVALLEEGSRLQSLLLPEDRAGFNASMQESAASLSVWNWEGRVWIDEWRDIKWINLRATPRALPDGSVRWEGIMSNITDSKAERQELISSGEQLAELSAHIETVKEQERARIAREIHDDVGGNLTAIKMALAMLARRLPENDRVLHEKAAYVDTLIDRTLESIHKIAGDLRPSVLDFGLSASIAWQAREFEKQTGTHCIFETNKEDFQLSSTHSTALFRIVQEALTNISKHANATEVCIRLLSKKDHMQLEVTDDGCGIAAEDCIKPSSFGIRSMRERTHALGFGFQIKGEKDKGTHLTITIPLLS